MSTMMKCGHAAQGYRVMKDGAQIPSCIICECDEPAEAQPKLEGRMARCTGYGKSTAWANRTFHQGCDKCKRSPTCKCEAPSSPALAFFHSKPDAPYDEYYCGCSGWD